MAGILLLLAMLWQPRANAVPAADLKTWKAERRPQLLASFESQVFGPTPPQPPELHIAETTTDRKALGGKAVRKQVTIRFSSRLDGPQMHLLLYLPASAPGPVPVFLGLNFGGNHTIHSDPGILMNDVWVREAVFDGGSGSKMRHLPPDDRTRGAAASNWQAEKILAHGYGLATVYYGDIEPDFAGGAEQGVRSVLPDAEQWGAIGAWAWGLSRAVDYLVADRGADLQRIAVFGHSRLGKAALWAAAQDPRIAMAISNESGKGGASLMRSAAGETVAHLIAAFPYWFSPNFRQYAEHPENLPVDGGDLLALIAPRPLYVASAEGDANSDPKSEFRNAANVGKVYALFGKKGLGTNQMPGLNQPVMRDVGYHVRAGRHDVTEFDWDQYLAFADLQWRNGAAK